MKGLNLSVRKGEIVGIAGIDGNGQSELIEAITGLRKVKSGKVFLDSKDVTGKNHVTLQNPVLVIFHKTVISMVLFLTFLLDIMWHYKPIIKNHYPKMAL